MTAFWADYCLGELTVSEIDGNHFNCLTGDNAQSVAKLLVDSWAEHMTKVLLFGSTGAVGAACLDVLARTATSP